jgi:hypothetical protein
MDALGQQIKCIFPSCEEYRRGYGGGHGLVQHLFFQHQQSGEQIQAALLAMKPPVTVLGEGDLAPDWWRIWS